MSSASAVGVRSPIAMSLVMWSPPRGRTTVGHTAPLRSSATPRRPPPMANNTAPRSFPSPNNTGHAREGARDFDAGHLLGLGDGGSDRLDGGVDVDDDAAPEPARGRGPDPDDVQGAAGRGLGDDRADLRGADVQADHEIRRLRALHRVPPRW